MEKQSNYVIDADSVDRKRQLDGARVGAEFVRLVQDMRTAQEVAANTGRRSDEAHALRCEREVDLWLVNFWRDVRRLERWRQAAGGEG
jgi:hypothetical protein